MSDAATRARELLAKATPGPWWLLNEYTEPWEEGDEWHVYGRVGNRIPRVVDNSEDQLTWADAELIAAAPILLAELADEVDRLNPVCSGCCYEPTMECPVHGWSRAELLAEVERLASENRDLSDYACVCVDDEWDLACPVHTDGEDVVSASERISELMAEVERLRAKADAFADIEEAHMASYAMLRQLLTVDDAMVERAARAICPERSDPEGFCPYCERHHIADARAALEAALGVES